MGICVNTHNLCDISKKYIFFENMRTNSFHESTNFQQKGSEMDENSKKLSLLLKKQPSYIIGGGSEISSKKQQKRSSTFNKRKNLNKMKSFYRSKTKKDFSERENEFIVKKYTKSFENNPSSNDVLTVKDPQEIRRLTISELGISSISKAILQEQEINIVIIGETNVGKTTFALKVSGKPFEKMYIPSISKEIKIKKTKFNSMNYLLKFSVIPGDECYQKDYTTLYNNAKFILVFYDVSKENSFIAAKNILLKEIKKYKGVFDNKNIDVVFVGNKIDLGKKSASQYNEIKLYCEEMKYDFIEMSVRTGIGFKGLLNKILNKTVQNQILFDGE